MPAIWGEMLGLNIEYVGSTANANDEYPNHEHMQKLQKNKTRGRLAAIARTRLDHSYAVIPPGRRPFVIEDPSVELKRAQGLRIFGSSRLWDEIPARHLL